MAYIAGLPVGTMWTIQRSSG